MAYRELSRFEKVARWFNQRRIGTAMLHKRSIRWFQKTTGLSNYQIQWACFLEGVILTGIVLYLIDPELLVKIKTDGKILTEFVTEKTTEIINYGRSYYK